MPILGADIAVHGIDGRFVAAIELKNRQNLTKVDAVKFRQNMLAHGHSPSSDYFLLISQDRGFLWSDETNQPGNSLPACEFSMREVIESYAPAIKPEERLRETELHLIITAWLRDLADGHAPATPAGTALAEVGFVEAIHNGTWMWETA